MKSKHSQVFVQIVAILGLALFCNEKATAQFSLIAEGNYATIRENTPLVNKKPLLGYSLGASLQFYPFKKNDKFSIINELRFTRKGYQQEFEEIHTFKFDYLALPILANYSLSKQISVQTGVELSKLVRTNIEHGTQTYNRFDIGLILGASFFNSHRISGYSRLTYGLLPMLDYYEIDELGNFKNEIHDLKNFCFSVGLKINLYNEKIRF